MAVSGGDWYRSEKWYRRYYSSGVELRLLAVLYDRRSAYVPRSVVLCHMKAVRAACNLSSCIYGRGGRRVAVFNYEDGEKVKKKQSRSELRLSANQKFRR